MAETDFDERTRPTVPLTIRARKKGGLRVPRLGVSAPAKAVAFTSTFPWTRHRAHRVLAAPQSDRRPSPRLHKARNEEVSR